MSSVHQVFLAVIRRFFKANFKKSIVLSYDTEKACNRNGYRLSSYLFSMGFPFSFPFTASEKRIYACSDGKVSAKKMSGEGHSPDTFSINFPSSLRCFASFGL